MNQLLTQIGVAIANSVLIALSVSAQSTLPPGSIDTDFASSDPGNIGRVRGSFSQALGFASTLQPDGKILVAGNCPGGAQPAPFCVARFNANGTADTTFGSNGIAATRFPESPEASANHLAVLRNGHIIVAGLCTIGAPSSFVVRPCYARFTSAGALTGGTNGSGRVVLNSTRSYEGSVVRVAEGLEGRLAIAGTCRSTNASHTRICVSGYTASDEPDGGFNSGSERDLVHFDNGTPYATTLADMVVSKSDQGLYFAATCDSPLTTFMCVGKLGNGGIFAPEFAGGGFSLLTNPGGGSANSLVEQFDGKVVVAGACANAGEFLRYCLGRFESNGSLDTSFGGGGSVKILLSSFTGTTATGLVQQPDGKLVAFSYCESAPSSPQLCVLRHQQSGALDSGFGSVGIARQTYPQFSNFRSQVLRPTGQLAIAGTCSLDICVRQTVGGPLSAKQCTLDTDGDGTAGTSNDYLLVTRAAMGFTGAAALQGASFSGAATRSTWSAIRTFLATQCGMSLAP
jgi:uncharacterized delta-60 repeat protein